MNVFHSRPKVARQIPIGKPQQDIINKVMKDMDLALKKKKPSKIQQSKHFPDKRVFNEY